MDEITSLEIGLGVLGLWLATLFVLWKLIDRKGYAGPVRNDTVKESLMLAHLALLVIGLAFIVSGLHIL